IKNISNFNLHFYLERMLFLAFQNRGNCPMTTNYIFVYGLLKSMYENDAARFIRSNCDFVSAGSFPGMLFDLGTYPGAVFLADSTSRVYGEVFEIIQNQEELVKYLDVFEGLSEENEQPYEYERVI